jgi:hypothetical protein
MSPSPEKAGRSSKSRTKSPCSPHAVGDADVDADVLVAVEVVLKDEVESWPFVEVALLESELGCAVTVPDDDIEADDEVGAWPFAREVPLEEVA